MKEVYYKFVRFKNKVQGFKKMDYDYLLDCIKQLLYHIC